MRCLNGIGSFFLSCHTIGAINAKTLGRKRSHLAFGARGTLAAEGNPSRHAQTTNRYSLPDSELVIEVSFRCAPDAARQPELNQATILTFARDALTAQIDAITKAHGAIPHELS